MIPSLFELEELVVRVGVGGSILGLEGGKPLTTMEPGWGWGL